MGFQSGLLRVLVLAAACLTLAARLPSAADGYQDSAVYNGHQNMPVHLVGVSREWNLGCLKGESAQCLRLADAFDTGLGDLVADERIALGYYLKACDQGVGPACARAATIVREGQASFSDAALAFKTADKGCNALHNPAACAALGVQYFRGAGVAADRARATQLWDQACGGGEDEGCRLKAGELFYGGGDQAAAVPIFQRACDGGKAWGCAGLARAYRDGTGVAADPAKASAAASRGCLRGAGDRVAVCGLYAADLVESDDKATLNKGEKLLNSACVAHDARACLLIGQIGYEGRTGATTTQLEGLYYLRRACDLNLAEGCKGLAKGYEEGVDEVQVEPIAAFALMDKACNLGARDVCARIARMPNPTAARADIPAINPASASGDQIRMAREFAANGRAREAVTAVFRLVHEGDEEAEWLAGGWLYYGLPGVIDPPRKADGLVSIENAARVGHVDAALFMGMAYWYGDGVAQNRTKGEEYIAIAGLRGSREAADIFRSMRAEPIRQENARRAEAYAAAAAARAQQAAWDAHWAAATAAWTASSAPAWQSPSSSWQSTASIMETSNFNQFINYMSGSTTACPSSNHYC